MLHRQKNVRFGGFKRLKARLRTPEQKKEYEELMALKKAMMLANTWKCKTPERLAWDARWLTFRRNQRNYAPMRLYPVAQSTADPSYLLGRLPTTDEFPDVTLWGDSGFADFYNDRIELFFPALMMGGKALLSAAAPTIVSAGKALMTTAVKALTQSEEKGEEEEEEEDEFDCSCDPDELRAVTPELIQSLGLRPIVEKDPSTLVGLFYDEGDGHYEFFFPLLAAALPALLGPIAGMLGGVRSKKKKKKEAMRGSERSGIGPPGPGEDEQVRRAIEQQQAVIAQQQQEIEKQRNELIAAQTRQGEQAEEEEEGF